MQSLQEQVTVLSSVSKTDGQVVPAVWFLNGDR